MELYLFSMTKILPILVGVKMFKIMKITYFERFCHNKAILPFVHCPLHVYM